MKIVIDRQAIIEFDRDNSLYDRSEQNKTVGFLVEFILSDNPKKLYRAEVEGPRPSDPTGPQGASWDTDL